LLLGTKVGMPSGPGERYDFFMSRVPSGNAWLHEIKHDGFRIVARKDGERSDGTSTLRATGRSSSATPANSI
jgi:hypothetical protein